MEFSPNVEEEPSNMLFNLRSRNIGHYRSLPVYELSISVTATESTLSSPVDVLSLAAISYGATITSVLAPDRCGKLEEITLCHRGEEELFSDLIGKEGTPYYGCIAGRVANRIRRGEFDIDGIKYSLAVNNGVNHLHGGLEGFDRKVWSWYLVVEKDGVETIVASDSSGIGDFEYSGRFDSAGIVFRYTSPDGEEGYPGEVQAEVQYSLRRRTSADFSLPSGLPIDLLMRYSAKTSAATPVNLTNHTYWNLSGGCRRKILDHELRLCAKSYLPVDETQIPTGAIASVVGTPFDFNVLSSSASPSATDPFPFHSLRKILYIDGGGMPGLDHCFVIDTDNPEGGDDGDHAIKVQMRAQQYSLRKVGELYDPDSGRRMTLHATQPGVQIYSANWLPIVSEEESEENTRIHKQHNAICLETQHFPDSINQPQFPSVLLRPGEIYDHLALYTFSIASTRSV